MSIKVAVEGIPITLENLHRRSYAMMEDMKKVIGDSALKIHRGAKKRCPVDMGALRESIIVNFHNVGLTADIEATMPYSACVEFGTSPHFPPVEPLALWVRRKLGIHDRSEARRVAYAICLKISRSGTKAQPFLYPAFEEIRDEYKQKLEEVVRRHTR